MSGAALRPLSFVVSRMLAVAVSSTSSRNSAAGAATNPWSRSTRRERDGRIAIWLHGKLVADFTNLRLRDVDTLKVDRAAVWLHIKDNSIHENTKWYDDVVIARSYIGPMAVETPDSAPTR